jgi:hypothetical protein
MIGHETVSEQAQGMLVLRFGHGVQKGSVVVWSRKEGSPAVGAVEGVINQAANHDAQRSAHGLMVTTQASAVKKNPAGQQRLCQPLARWWNFCTQM